MASWQSTSHSFNRDMTGNCDLHKTAMMRGPEAKLVFNILAKLKELREGRKLCDLIFQVDRSLYPAHKAVIAAWSPKIASLILSQKDLKSDQVITVNYDNTSVFSAFLDYCYSGVIMITELNVYSLLDIGMNLCVDSLVESCEDYLKSTLSHANFVSRFITSVKYSLNALEETLITYLETNLAVLVCQGELLNLRPQDFHVFLTAGKMNDIKMEVKLSLIINWVNYCQVDRNKLLLFLLSQLIWDDSIGDLLIQISCSEILFTSNELCSFQLLQYLMNNTGHDLGPLMAAYTRLYSIYSHMIDELTLPKCFSESISRIEDIVCIPVSVVTQMKDAEVNTDVDSTYFSESYASQQLETLEETTDIAIIPDTLSASATTASNGDLDTEKTTTEVLIKTEIFTLSNSDERTVEVEEEQRHVYRNTETATKRRRKGNPRKVSVKETKVKKGRGKSRTVKTNENIEAVKATPDESKRKTRQQKSNTDLGTEKDLTIDKFLSESSNKNERETAEIVAENLENGQADASDIYEEEKPKLRLNLKGKNLKQSKIRLKQVKSKSKKHPADDTYKPTIQKSSKKLKCTYEGCSFATKGGQDQLDRHIDCMHVIQVTLQCEKCDYKTNQMKLFLLHMKTHYKHLPYVCEKQGCNQKFQRMCLFVRHQLTHLEDKPFKCDQPACSKSFASVGQLRVHRKNHEVGRQFACDICNQRFTTKGVMQQHRVIHFKNKSYLCDTCGFSTKHQSHLISHRKIHSGDVLRCTFPNCYYYTPKQGHMTQHMNTHLNIRDHICQVCGKSFVVRGKLLRHERIHSKEKLYKCKQCDYQTSRTDRMKLHIESHGMKFKRKKWNEPYDNDDDSDTNEVDFHQLYERVQPGENKTLDSKSEPIQGLTDIPIVSVASIKDMKTMDTLSLAASTSMIIDSYPSSKHMMDPISGEAVTCIEDSLTFQQSFERIHTTGFDQL